MGFSRFVPRSIFVRVTIASVVIALLATGTLYAVTRWVVLDQSNAALARTVDTDLAGLVDIYASSGPEELTRRLSDRLILSNEGRDQVHYLFATTDGRLIAGNIRRWPNISAENSQNGFITLPSGAAVFARATLLSSQHKLLVAREYVERDALLARIAVAFAVSCVGVILMTTAVGQGAALRLRRRVKMANQAMRVFDADAPMLNDPSPDARRDEVDLLSHHVRRILARQTALIESHRNISDQTAHELRTPLMHLDMQLVQTIERTKDRPLLEMLVQARQQIRDIIRMLESLLDIASNEALHGDQRQLSETNLSDAFQSLIELFVDSANDRGLTLEADLTPNVMMTCDSMQMSRMLANLLDNALKYVPAGGTIKVSLDPGPVIRVVDNGPGIPREQRESIFERFQRSGRQDGRGHGLGLALVRAIAERHGLVVSCDDADPGAAFVISPRNG